ncbi:hypothetical protein HS041_36665 [Planomonospora sp. ID67723]|uniref:hypothetical protein n=1 Tax=Planomonospora sp. ID67723 TaxID=2738134 RepID=UPI0018C3B0DB|nr:hypothetical protein [Planomonospora sp. ID67723]MBG0833239.1 hypothetical protein [Planomonospora sp. ID67723]
MIAGYVADLTATLRILSDDERSTDIRSVLGVLTSEGDTLLLPVTTLTQATIIADPDPEDLMWLLGFRACEIANLTNKDVFRVARQARHAARPHDTQLHHAHTAYLAMTRGWPVLTADPAGWAGYGHLELVEIP